MVIKTITMESNNNNNKKRRKISKESLLPPIKPYTTIFNPMADDVFLDGFPVEAKIINYEETKFILSPYIYHIELNHGNFCWIIKKRFSQFRQLHNQIWIFYTKLTIPLPTEYSRQNRKILETMGEIDWPKFPFLPETFFVADGISRRIKILEDYLKFLLSKALFRYHPALLEFIEVSPYSFIEDLGLKGEEVLVKKRAGGFRSAAYCVRIENFFTDLTGHWRRRWLVVKDTCLFYIAQNDKKIRYVMLFDPDFYVDSGIKETGIAFGVRIRNLSRQLVLKCYNAKKAKDLADYLNDYSKLHAKDFVSRNRFGSFVPVRKDVFSQWFVDGCAYFEAVSQAMELAQEEIYITDWWLSPEIYLQRPSLGLDWRLDRLLMKKAQNGVKIFILLYKEMEIGISINSIYTKRTLMRMHQNICVLRHPDAVRGGPLLWSHHEKLVVIDQKIAFVGGIDLCFGRWDDFEHRLTDQGGIYFKPNHDIDLIRTSTRPGGILYRSVSQPMIAEPNSLANFSGEKHNTVTVTENLDPEPESKHFDETVETRSMASIEDINNNIDKEDASSVISKSGISNADSIKTNKKDTSDDSDGSYETDEDDDDRAVDEIDQQQKKIVQFQNSSQSYFKGKISNHFRRKKTRAMARLRNMKKRIKKKVKSVHLDVVSIVSSDEDNNENSLDFIKQAIPKIKTADDISMDELEGAAKLWLGKDYTNFIVKDFTHLNMPFQDSIDRNNTPRMPWHDLSCVVLGAAARDVARHFIQRWNHTKFYKAKFKDRYPWLVPKSYNIKDLIEIPSYLTRAHRVKCQVLRSVSSWSIGIRKTEASIVDAYIEAINQAEHYIYIENQFFISQTKTHLESNDLVKNRIAEAIYRRIIRAFKNDKNFKVFILIPLLPAFEGEVGTSSGTAIQQITHYNYSTIVKGYDSILSKLKLEIDDPSKYIGFYSLRNHDKLNGRLVTELIYIHSKMLIADDKVTIIGSANINDRSMLGNRDSEVAVIIEDQEYDFYFMDNKPYKSGKFSGSLRRMLMREHLGIYKENKEDMLKMTDLVNDPICEQFWNDTWNSIAKMNTVIYEEVFAVIPTDEVRKLSEIPSYLERDKLYKIDRAKAEEKLATIKGHLVMLPLKFLSDEENISNTYSAQDRFIPQIVWT